MQLEATRRGVRDTFEWLARRIDGWFGDTPIEPGASAVGHGYLSLAVLRREGERTDVDVRFDARLHLPNIERSAYVFVGRDNERDTVSDKADMASRQQRGLAENRGEQSFFAGVGMTLRDLFDFRVGFRGGLKPYAQARYREHWRLAEVSEAEFRQTFFWSLDDHFGSTTSLGFQHTPTRELALRWLNQATITERSRRLEWTTLLGGYQAFGEQRQLSLEAVLLGAQKTGVKATDYGLRLKWEQPLYADWLIGEAIVGHYWPRPDAASERTGAWAFGLGLRLRI